MRSWICGAAIWLCILPASRADQKRYEFLLAALNAQVRLAGGCFDVEMELRNLEDLTSPPEAVKNPAKRVTILFSEQRFTNETHGEFDLRHMRPVNLPPDLRCDLKTALKMICERIDGVFVVTNEAIEIVPAARFWRQLEVAKEGRGNLMPLVHCNFQKAPLSQVLAELAERTECSIVLTTQVPEKVAEQAITVKLVNVPAQSAIETVAEMADLRVIVRGNAYFVTTKQQASEMKAIPYVAKGSTPPCGHPTENKRARPKVCPVREKVIDPEDIKPRE
jgi:hypothetical protein